MAKFSSLLCETLVSTLLKGHDVQEQNFIIFKKLAIMRIWNLQVRELHRVYSVQKMLMDDLKNEIRQQQIWNHMNDINVSHPHSIKQQHQTTQISHQPDFHVQNLRGRGFDLERPAEEDIFIRARGFDEGEAGPSSHTAFQRCKTSTSGYDEEMEVDLTLSIGVSQVKKNSHLPQLVCSNSTNNGETRKLNSPASLKLDRTR